MVGSVVNGTMFLLIIFSYLTSSALPFVIEVSVDLLNIGLKQHVVNTGELFRCCDYYIPVLHWAVDHIVVIWSVLITEHLHGGSYIAPIC